ncbi:hypothetical protein T10_12638 [Trichinella papuae]|uniref:Uncharacterized protein n=1 Tax=Trichinella papuae TaxID=268474 RepID=A0A0V1MB85_9BILA|nr:hypothetical protein T10_12638 [Trichinella papuae]
MTGAVILILTMKKCNVFPHVGDGVSSLSHQMIWHNQINKNSVSGFVSCSCSLKQNSVFWIPQFKLINFWIPGDASVGNLRRVNSVYAEKAGRVAQYAGKYTSGRHTLKQFHQVMMCITPELI